MTQKKTQPQQPEQIAIVGLGGLFPGSVDVTAFWNNILRGTDLVTDIPDSHWSVEDYFAEDAMKRPASAVDKTYARRGAFLPKVPFETLKEGIPPSLLPSTDTAQLLSLMVARVALEECFGGPVDQADRSRVSCILGVTSGQELFGQMASRLAWPQWIAGMRAAGIDDVAAKKAADEIAKCFTPWSEASFPGLLGNVVAGRIANRLDLGGSNAVTDAACASSFAAVSMGVDELLLGRADVVLTGGVDTLNDIFMYMCFTKTPALSASGECRPFDAKADGTLLGEGLGMLALKRLSDAERDGNTIYALISGIGTSSDGRSKSVYAPVSEGQAKALVRAYESAGYPATTVELVEAHGTGTKAGDVAELGGLRLAFDDARWAKTERQFCAIGSVKSQIGHTKSAAGAAGLIKAALALHEKVLPPTIKVDTPNPQADFVTSPFYVNAGLRPWFRGSDHPRRAGVSSFGFGGSNWHITLSEYQGGKDGASVGRREVEVLALSATTKAALQERAAGMVAAIGEINDFAVFCAQENAFFDAGAQARVSFVASSVDELSKRLQQVARGEASPTIFWGEGLHNGATAFIFPGQGSQVVEMGKAMALAFDDARAVWDRGCDVLPDVVRTAYPPTAFDDATRAAQQQALTQTENAQPALGLASIAALRVLQRLGVPMDMAAGHSFGELSALCAAGVFDEAALLRLARRRGELMKAASTTPGAMAAVVGDTSGLAALLVPFAGRVVLANDNAPDQAVISGEKAAVDEAIAAIEKTGLRVKKLPVSTAFHSPLVAAACEPLLESLRGTAMQAPSVPVFANTTAAAHSDDVDVIRQALSEQVRAPVRFVEEIRAMAKAGATVFIEVGSGTVLTGLVSRIVPDATAIAFDPNKGLSGISAALARLCAAGVPVDLGALPAQRPLPKPVAPSKTAVMISGANVGRPPRPAPAPVTISAVSTSVSAPAVAAKVVTSVVQESSKLPVAAPVPAMTSRPATPPAPAAPAVAAQTVPAGAISGAGQTVPHGAISSAPSAGWLQVFSEGQQQTMDAHLAFQKALSDAHTAYLGAFESTSNALVQALSGRATLPAAPAFALPAMTAPVAAPVRTAPVAAPVVTAPVVVAPKAPVAAPVVAPKAAVVAAPVAVVAAAGVDIRAALYAVVADKTGYPTSALDDSMHLESDLGIDSIKRVEILGALKEKVPAAASLDALKLAQLATLGEIAAAIAAVAGSAPTKAAPAAPVAASTGSAVDTRAALYAVVADKTGYPTSALDDSMHLESDLGIDSIKRVEILGALKEKVPAAASLDALKLAQLATLGEIAAAIAAVSGGVSGAAPAVAKAAVVAALVVASAPAGNGVDARAALFAVVAEKTGYPTSALDDSMHLESDLGIDSIKRVEILGALKEQVPAAASLDALKLAQLATLGEIAAAIAAVSGAAPAKAVVVATVVAAPVVASKPAGNGVDPRAALFAVVAEKTGYPTSALDDAMHLESDLGIDSIKRVEILGALKEQVPAAATLDALKLAQLATLGEIAAAIIAVSGAPAASAPLPATPAASSSAAPTATVDTCPRAVVRLATAARGTPDLPPGPVVIVEGGPISAALASRIAASVTMRGVDVTVTTATALPAVIGTLVDLCALDAHGDGVAALTDGLFRLQTAGAALKASTGRALMVANGGGRFAPEDGVAAFGLSGLTKTARQEWPGVDVRFVDVDLADSQAAELVASQCFVTSDAVEVGLSSRQQLTPTVLDAPILDGAPSNLVRGDVVVITGGARGVTATCALALTKAVPGLKLALLQRTVVDAPEPFFARDALDEGALKRAILADAAARGTSIPLREVAGLAQQILAAREVRTTLATLRQTADVDLFACDVQKPESVEAALAAVRRRFGPITVVVHGAGVLADKRIEDKTREQVKSVVGTKVGGLFAILEHTASDPLKALVAFSSVAGRFGNVGQVDYAMANEAMTRILTGVKAKRPSLLVKSLHWGPWEGGMVTPELKAAFASRGITVIARDDGARAFVSELSTAASDDVEVVLGASLASARPTLDGPGSVKKTSTRIDATSMPFLVDHAVKGEVVLPVVVAMDLMLGAAVDAGVGTIQAIGDVEVLRGQRLPQWANDGHLAETSVFLDDVGGARRLRIELRVDGTLAYRATAMVGGVAANASAPITVPVVSKATFARPLYAGSGGPGLLFHGPRFQLIDALDGVSDHSMTARVLSTQAAGFAGRFASDVAALDAGLQLVLLWARHRTGGAFLPTRVGSLALHQGALPEGLLTCVVDAKAPLLASDVRATADVHFIDSRGVRVCSMLDVVAHRLPDDDAFGATFRSADLDITAPAGAAE